MYSFLVWIAAILSRISQINSWNPLSRTSYPTTNIYIFAKAIVFILYLKLISSAIFLNLFIHLFVNFFILQGMFWSSSSSQRCWVRVDKEIRIFIFSCALFGWFVLIHCCSFLWIRAVMGMVTLGNIMSQILSGRVTPESPIVKCIYKNFKKVK